jgi:hypothetical protein
MKKIFFAIAFFTFVGSMAVTAYAANNGSITEISKDDDKKKKKKKKGCCSGETKAAGCSEGSSTQKPCCTKKQ